MPPTIIFTARKTWLPYKEMAPLAPLRQADQVDRSKHFKSILQMGLRVSHLFNGSKYNVAAAHSCFVSQPIAGKAIIVNKGQA